MGFSAVEDLLFHLPERWQDRRRLLEVGEIVAKDALTVPEEVTLRGRLRALRLIRLRGGRRMVVGQLEDASGRLPVRWLNRPYLVNQVDEEAEYCLHGALRRRSGGWELLNPSCERLGGPESEGGEPAELVSVYPALAGIGPARVRALVEHALDAGLPEDPLPEGLRARHGLLPLGQALTALHRPEPDALPDRPPPEELPDGGLPDGGLPDGPARRRLAYGELLDLQLAHGLARARRRSLGRRRTYRGDAELRRSLFNRLPFEPTAAQRRAVEEIAADLGAPWPMCRLLQGDVGSGKTAVAALALAIAAESGHQAALMAPTELLAEQHLASLRGLLGCRCEVALVTASSSQRPAALEALERGEVPLAVGTHALLEEGVAFHDLALVVVDEQHRFGVGHRHRLLAKANAPDLLAMTATPIPRTLALACCGDLDLSTLDEMPPGRAPVETELLPTGKRGEAHARLAAALQAGEQAFVVYPRIGEGPAELASLEKEGEALAARLGAWPGAVLHGKLGRPEREAAAAAFAAGELRWLAATTVVEVGVDVPAATFLVIENAERFGLAQLHQLRGRVGRGERGGTCIALCGEVSEEARRRLEVFASTADGFRLAEEDLRLRGPGDLLGLRQAGRSPLRVADPLRDRALLEAAAADARGLLPRLDEPEMAPLARHLERRVLPRLGALEGG